MTMGIVETLKSPDNTRRQFKKSLNKIGFLSESVARTLLAGRKKSNRRKRVND